MVAYLTLFFVALLAATILPFSSEALLLGYLASGLYSVPSLVLVATIGNVMGSVINWALGRFLLGYQDHKWFPVSAKEIERAQKTFERYGRWTLLLAWMPIIGDPLTVVAGFLKMPLLPFLILVTIGKATRYGFIGWWFL